MAASDQTQRSDLVPQHKRLAQGEKLDGTSYQPKGGSTPSAKSKGGGLAHVKPKK
jgi:hypothetical protein